MSKTIYDLELHEGMVVINSPTQTISAVRVPGGWFYITVLVVEAETGNKSASVSSVFVPLSKEFKKPNENVFG